MSRPDFLIVGAGVVGCATALELARAGARVRVIERGEAGQESSWAGGGILFPLLPWDYSDGVNRLVLRSLARFPGWIEGLRAGTGLDPEYQSSGMLVLPPCDATAAASWCAAHGYRQETPRARAIVPGLAVEEDALWLPDVTQVRNPRLLNALRRALEISGVELVEHAAALAWTISGARVHALETARGPMSAGNYIVAAGAWSRTLLDARAEALDVRPIRGQMLLFRTGPDVLRHIVLKGGIYLIPRRDGHVLAGSTLEDVGFDKRTTQAAGSMLLERAAAMLPLLGEARLVRHWAGLRPGSPENVPVIARHPALENLYVNSGHFRYGVTMAPASAEILANLALGRPQAIDASPYHWPLESGLPFTDKALIS